MRSNGSSLHESRDPLRQDVVPAPCAVVLSAAENAAVKNELLSAIPALRAFAISLVRNSDRADDLVQETLLKAWAGRARYQPGTSMPAWLSTILRNAFYSQYRKSGYEVQDVDGNFADALSTPPRQDGHMDLQDLRMALEQIPLEQREALVLVGAAGFAYAEAATICSCAEGTIKSRANRGRQRLAEILGLEAKSNVH